MTEVQVSEANYTFYHLYRDASIVSVSFSVFPSHHPVYFRSAKIPTLDKFTKLQGPHLLLNRCWWQVSPWILIGPCIMSKNDGAGLEPAKVTQSHPFTQTNGINECSLSGTLLQPIRLPLSSSVSHSLSNSLFSLVSLTRCIHCHSLSSRDP